MLQMTYKIVFYSFIVLAVIFLGFGLFGLDKSLIAIGILFVVASALIRYEIQY